MCAFGALGLDKVLKQFLEEYTAGGQIIVILLQRIQRLFQGGKQTPEFCLFFFRQMVLVYIIGAPALA